MANQVIIPDLACIREFLHSTFDKLIVRYKWTVENGSDLDTRTQLNGIDPRIDGRTVGWNRESEILHPDTNEILMKWANDNTTSVGPEAVYVDFKILTDNYPTVEDVELRIHAFWYATKADGQFQIEFETWLGGTIEQVGFDFINQGGTLQQRFSIDVFSNTQYSYDILGDYIGYLTYNLPTMTAIFTSEQGLTEDQLNGTATYTLILPSETAAILNEIAETVPDLDQPAKVCPAEPDAIFSRELQPPGTTPFAPFCGPVVIPPFSATGPGPVYTEISSGESNPWFYSHSTDTTNNGGDFPYAWGADGIGEGWRSRSYKGKSIAIGKKSFSATLRGIAIGENASEIIADLVQSGTPANQGLVLSDQQLLDNFDLGNPSTANQDTYTVPPYQMGSSIAIGHNSLAVSSYWTPEVWGSAESLNENRGGGDSSVTIGNWSSSSTGSVSVGHDAHSTGNSVMIGVESGIYKSGNSLSIGIGSYALAHEGYSTLGEGAGISSKNIAIGYGAMQKIWSAQYCIVIGNDNWPQENFLPITKPTTAGLGNVIVGHGNMPSGGLANYNTAIGYNSLVNNVEGNYNTSLGSFTLPYPGLRGGGVYSKVENITCIGYQADVSGNNQVQLGNSATTTYVYGSVQARSDVRDKTDIRNTSLGLDFINRLRPVDFKWDYREDYIRYYQEEEEQDGKKVIVNKHEVLPKDGSRKRNRYHHGLIAQELKEVIDEMGIDFGGYQDHSVKGGGDVLSVGYQELIAPLIKAIQELSLQVEDLQSQLNDMKEQKYK